MLGALDLVWLGGVELDGTGEMSFGLRKWNGFDVIVCLDLLFFVCLLRAWL